MTAGARCPHRVPPFLASIRQYSIGISWKTTHDLETQIEYFRRPGAWRPAEYQPPVDNLDLSNSRSPAVLPTRALLSLAEADLAAARAKLLELNLPRPPVSFDTLRAIHHELFHDVCTWAGQVRTTQIDKRQYDDHTSRVQMFATPDTIEARADALFRSLTEQNFLAGSNRDGFAAGAAVFAELNAIHFARKGNGRTNRLLLSARAANAGHALAFDLITRERMIAVSVAADEDDPSGLRRMHPHHPRWATLRRRADRARGNRLRAAG